MKELLLAKALEHYSNGIFAGVNFVGGVMVNHNGEPITDIKTLATYKVFLNETLTVAEAEAVMERSLTTAEKGQL